MLPVNRGIRTLNLSDKGLSIHRPKTLRFDADGVRVQSAPYFPSIHTRRAPTIVAAIGVRTRVSDARKTLRKRKNRQIQRAASTHILVAERNFRGNADAVCNFNQSVGVETQRFRPVYGRALTPHACSMNAPLRRVYTDAFKRLTHASTQ